MRVLIETLASSAADSSEARVVTSRLWRAALRRGVVVMPAGIALGWLLGRSRSGANAEQEATVLALYLGLAFVPSFAASVHVSRISRGMTGTSGARTAVAAIGAGVAWGVFGGLAMYVFGLVTTVEISGPGALVLGAGSGLVAGVLGALLGFAAGRLRRR